MRFKAKLVLVWRNPVEDPFKLRKFHFCRASPPLLSFLPFHKAHPWTLWKGLKCQVICSYEIIIFMTYRNTREYKIHQYRIHHQCQYFLPNWVIWGVGLSDNKACHLLSIAWMGLWPGVRPKNYEFDETEMVWDLLDTHTFSIVKKSTQRSQQTQLNTTSATA